MSEENQEKINLFSVVEGTRSTIDSTRDISLHRGKCFKMVYRDTQKLKLHRELYGRIVDLQPIFAEGRLQGIRLLYRRGRWDGTGWTESRELQDSNFGPFDTLSTIEAEVKIPGEDIDDDGKPMKRALSFKAPAFALSQAVEHSTGKKRQMLFVLLPGM